MNQEKANMVRALLQGLTGAGLFRRLDYPGAPTEFIDSRPLDEVLNCGEYERVCAIYEGAERDMQGANARRRAAHEFEEEATVRSHH
jgi:hypothetical protein